MELYELRHVVNLALDVIAGDSSFLEAEVCASWCEQQIAELSHDTAQPENAGPSLRDETACGFSILLVMADGAGRKVGFGVDRDDLTRDSIALALEIAKQSAVVDPGFTSLPKPPEAIPTAPMLHDPAVMSLSDDAVAGLASEALDGALSTFREAAVEAPFRISGEVRSRTELLVVGNSHGLLAEDTSTALLRHSAWVSRLATEPRCRQPQRHASQGLLTARCRRRSGHRGVAGTRRHGFAGWRVCRHLRSSGRCRPVSGYPAAGSQPRYPGKRYQPL